MKKLVPILFLFVLFGPLTIAFSWLHFQKKMIRKQVKNEIIHTNKEQLVTLSFNDQEAQKIIWKKPNHEFEYQGEMYDIVERKNSKGKIEYLCWHDNKETALNKKLDILLGIALTKNPDRKKNLFQISQYLKTLYTENINPEIPEFTLHKNTGVEHNNLQIKSLTYSPPTPPPEFI